MPAVHAPSACQCVRTCSGVAQPHDESAFDLPDVDGRVQTDAGVVDHVTLKKRELASQTVDQTENSCRRIVEILTRRKQWEEKSKKQITRELVATVLSRKPKMSSFLEWKDLKVVYKR